MSPQVFLRIKVFQVEVTMASNASSSADMHDVRGADEINAFPDIDAVYPAWMAESMVFPLSRSPGCTVCESDASSYCFCR